MLQEGLVPAGPASRHPATPKRRLSDLLAELADGDARDRVSIGDLLAALQDRATGSLMFVLALPNVVPAPPGTSSVLAAPLVLLAAQLALGWNPWLPSAIAGRSLARESFRGFVRRAHPWLLRMERFLRPRLPFATGPRMERAVGAVCLLLALILLLPIPLGNMLPAAAICLMSLGIVERDGLWVLGGLAAAAVSGGLVAGVLYALAEGAIFLFLAPGG